MKKTLFILLVLISFNTFSQKSYLELRKEYQQHCDSIVTDTIKEQGFIKYKINPKDGDLKLIPQDTTWYERDCREYKEGYNNLIFSGSSLTVSSGTLLNNSTQNNYLYSTSTESFTTEIKRFKYCKCKYKKGSQEDFWNWVEEKYLK